MRARQLTVLMSGQTAGRVTRAAGGGGPLVFEYDESPRRRAHRGAVVVEHAVAAAALR